MKIKLTPCPAPRQRSAYGQKSGGQILFLEYFQLIAITPCMLNIIWSQAWWSPSLAGFGFLSSASWIVNKELSREGSPSTPWKNLGGKGLGLESMHWTNWFVFSTRTRPWTLSRCRTCQRYIKTWQIWGEFDLQRKQAAENCGWSLSFFSVNTQELNLPAKAGIDESQKSKFESRKRNFKFWSRISRVEREIWSSDLEFRE